MSWGAVRYEDLYGPNGWCNGEVPSFHCPCRWVGGGSEGGEGEREGRERGRENNYTW